MDKILFLQKIYWRLKVIIVNFVLYEAIDNFEYFYIIYLKCSVFLLDKNNYR